MPAGESASTIAGTPRGASRNGVPSARRADRGYKPRVHGENARRELLEQTHQTALLQKVSRGHGGFHGVGVIVDDEVVHAVVDERLQRGHHLGRYLFAVRGEPLSLHSPVWMPARISISVDGYCRCG